MNIIRRIKRDVRNILYATQKYKNWREITTSIFIGRNPTRVVLENGIQIYAPENGELLALAREIFFEGIYNPVNLPVEANDTVVDIGANIGVFTLFAAHKTRNTVYAFEPFPESFEFLNRNIRINNLHNVIAYSEAVCDKIGMAKLFRHEYNLRHRLFVDDGKRKLEKYIEVPTTTLLQIMESNNLKQIDFLKLDCEGAEAAILQSTPIDYLKRIRKIAMEYHENISPLVKHDEIEKLLFEAGFVTEVKWNYKARGGFIYGLTG
ncbi:MAG TPA: FkbM family methyltransferase [Candidatus Hypogeohydataceae bacterium YC41]